MTSLETSRRVSAIIDVLYKCLISSSSTHPPNVPIYVHTYRLHIVLMHSRSASTGQSDSVK
jgi:hypothetical protein